MKQVLVYLNTGKVFEFNDVTEIKPITQGISFKYRGKSTDVDRKVFFNYTSVAGWSVADTED